MWGCFIDGSCAPSRFTRCVSMHRLSPLSPGLCVCMHASSTVLRSPRLRGIAVEDPLKDEGPDGRTSNTTLSWRWAPPPAVQSPPTRRTKSSPRNANVASRSSQAAAGPSSSRLCDESATQTGCRDTSNGTSRLRVAWNQTAPELLPLSEAAAGDGGRGFFCVVLMYEYANAETKVTKQPKY